jgi:hypothetical protein
MAQTPAAVQAALNAVSPAAAKIIAARELHDTDSTNQHWYVIGGVDAPGRTRWVTSVRSDSAANQAVSILAALRAT